MFLYSAKLLGWSDDPAVAEGDFINRDLSQADAALSCHKAT